MRQTIDDYFRTLGALPGRALATDGGGRPISLDAFFEAVSDRMREAAAGGNKLMFIGNGGSASIASHMAIDFGKNGGIPALAFNDGVTLTCLGNDLGYDQVFARQIALHGRPGDVLFAISSSGRSANILNGVAAMRALVGAVVGFSGFQPDNPLRALGDWNLYVPSGEYGFVEIAHLSFCHAILDLAMGWTLERGLWSNGMAQRGAA